MRKERNKLKPSELNKIQERYMMKYREFSNLDLYDTFEEDGITVKVKGLRSIFREQRMSSTDKRALIAVVDEKLNKIRLDNIKKNREESLEEVNIDAE